MTKTGKYTVIADRKVRLLPGADQENLQGEADIQHVFIIGSKGIPAQYGGFETFVEKLTQYRKTERIRYHVSRMAVDDQRFEYNGAACFDIRVPYIGPARAVVCDLIALRRSIDYCKAHPQVRKPVFYVLACRIGPFIAGFRREIHDLGGVLYINPDGHEWKRAKWSRPVQKYWKTSEGLMVRSADLLVCDSKNIEKYIRKTYRKYHPKTRFIAYGSEVEPSAPGETDVKYEEWLKAHGLRRKEYYLVVGRFVPENNFETMIREFMASDSERDFAIITTTNGKFYNRLLEAREKLCQWSKEAPMDRGNGSFNLIRARYFRRRGWLAGALGELDGAILMDPLLPNLPDVEFEKAQIYEALKDNEKAKELYRKIKDEYPNHIVAPWARDGLIRLRQ